MINDQLGKLLTRSIGATFNANEPLLLIGYGRRKKVMGYHWVWTQTWMNVKYPRRVEDWTWETYEIARAEARSFVTERTLTIVPVDTLANWNGPSLNDIETMDVVDRTGNVLMTGPFRLSAPVEPHDTVSPKFTIDLRVSVS